MAQQYQLPALTLVRQSCPIAETEKQNIKQSNHSCRPWPGTNATLPGDATDGHIIDSCMEPLHLDSLTSDCFAFQKPLSGNHRHSKTQPRLGNDLPPSG